MFPPGNSIGCGNLEPQSITGSPPADDFIDTHSFLHRAKKWEKLKENIQKKFVSVNTELTGTSLKAIVGNGVTISQC